MRGRFFGKVVKKARKARSKKLETRRASLVQVLNERNFSSLGFLLASSFLLLAKKSPENHNPPGFS
jgi:hypothetical protein